MSVLTRPQWSPPRLPRDLQVELSPLSASSAGSPGELGEEEAAYGGSLIMVQHLVEHTTEQAAEAEDEERLCSVVLDPLPNSLLQSLSAQGHVRMHRPPAAQPISAQGHETMADPPQIQPVNTQGPERMLRPPAAATWPLHDVPPETAFLPAEAHHHHHRKKSRKARRESHDSERSRKKRKRSTSSSSGCEPETARVNPIFVWVTQTESTITQVMCEDYDKRNRIRLTKTPNGWRAIPRTNLQPAIQSEPVVETDIHSSDDTLDLSAKKYHETNHESEMFESEDDDNHESNFAQECKQEHVDQQDKMLELEGEENMEYIVSEECKEVQVTEESDMFALEEEDNVTNLEETPDQSELLMSELEAVAPDNSEEFACDLETVVPETTEYVPDLEAVIAENIEMLEEDQLDPSSEEQAENYCHFEDENMLDNFVDEIASNLDSKEVEDEAQNLSVLDADAEANHEQIEGCDLVESVDKKSEEKEDLALEVKKKDFDAFEFDCGVKCDPVKEEKKVFTEPPPAHATSTPVKLEEDKSLEPPADLSCKRKRRLSGILPCRSVLRLPPLVARSYTSPVPLSSLERGSPSPAHDQVPCLPPANTPVCGDQSPPHAHQQRAATTNLLEGLLSQQPLALDTTAKRPAVSKEPTPKRRKCEDVTLRSLLKVTQEATPPSRLLELLTTSAPSRRPSVTSPPAVPRRASVTSPPATPRRPPVASAPDILRRLSVASPPAPPRRASVTSPLAVNPVPSRTPTQTTSPPLDALAQLRLVLQEVAVPDPLLVPRSRLAALLANPATEIPRLVRSPPPTTPDTLAVSLSRLHALLKRPDSELLAWAARDWAKPTAKLSVPKAPAKPTLPWWLPNKAVPPPPSPEILAAIHAMYGPTLMQPQYFAPHFPAWSVPTPPAPATQPPVTPQQPATKPRIACKSLVELLAKKPEEPPALNLVRAPAKPQRRELHRPSPPEKDSSCPRLWHPLFGSQKCDSWNWRPVSVRGE